MGAMESHWLLSKSIAAKESYWLLWKENGLLWKINGCNIGNYLLLKVTGFYGKLKVALRITN
jgi:hypothetical protein